MQITPFTVDVPQAEVDDLIARIANTRWPSDVVVDWSRGVPTSYARKLADYWANEYDWPAQQAVLNTFPQFTTSIDGQTIYFVHVRSSVEGATPLLLLHGYPSSFVEFSRMIGPLVDPAAHGARAEDAFHVVIPSPPSGSTAVRRCSSRESDSPLDHGEGHGTEGVAERELVGDGECCSRELSQELRTRDAAHRGDEALSQLP